MAYRAVVPSGCAIAGTRSCDARCPLCMASSQHARARARSWRVLTHTRATNTLARTPRRVDPPNETYYFYLLVPLFEVLLFVGWANVANVLMNPFRRYPDGIDWPAAESSCSSLDCQSRRGECDGASAARAPLLVPRARAAKGKPSGARAARARADARAIFREPRRASAFSATRRSGRRAGWSSSPHQRKGEQHGRLRTEPRQPERDGALSCDARPAARTICETPPRRRAPPSPGRPLLQEAEEVQATETCQGLLLPSCRAHGARARAHAPATHVVGG